MRGPSTQRAFLAVGLLIAALSSGTACRRPPAVQGVGQSAPEPGAGAATAPAPSGGSDSFGRDSAFAERDLTGTDLPGATPLPGGGEGKLETIYFDFDQSSLTEVSRGALDRNAAFLRSSTTLRVRIEGHCDERGSVEYNLALGDRRAAAAKQYLIQKGVALSRLETVSYGEEQPADPGHNEASWAKNRRAEFHVR